MSCVVACIALGVDVFLRGSPARPYILWGDRVTWKVLTEYSWSHNTTRSPAATSPGHHVVVVDPTSIYCFPLCSSGAEAQDVGV